MDNQQLVLILQIVTLAILGYLILTNKPCKCGEQIVVNPANMTSQYDGNNSEETEGFNKSQCNCH